MGPAFTPSYLLHNVTECGSKTISIFLIDGQKQGGNQDTGLSWWLSGKESTCNAGDPSWIPGSGRSTGEGLGYPFQYSWASLVAQLVKNSPAMCKTWVQSLDWEDPLEKEMDANNIL